MGAQDTVSIVGLLALYHHPMSHLEDLLCEYLMWMRHLVLRNEKVGKLDHGGHGGELDIVAYLPGAKAILHLEPSLDADTWKRREERYTKKFAAGREHIPTLFQWLDPLPPIRQIAIFVSAAPDRTTLACGEVVTVDEVAAEIRHAVCEQGKTSEVRSPNSFRSFARSNSWNPATTAARTVLAPPFCREAAADQRKPDLAGRFLVRFQ